MFLCDKFDRFFFDLRKTCEELKVDGEVLVVGTMVKLVLIKEDGFIWKKGHKIIT